jgi:hypothetical protein
MFNNWLVFVIERVCVLWGKNWVLWWSEWQVYFGNTVLPFSPLSVNPPLIHARLRCIAVFYHRDKRSVSGSNDHLHSAAGIKNVWVCTSSPSYILVAWYSITYVKSLFVTTLQRLSISRTERQMCVISWHGETHSSSIARKRRNSLVVQQRRVWYKLRICKLWRSERACKQLAGLRACGGFTQRHMTKAL